MRHIIYGAGAIGGSLGARLHLAGKQVVLIARGDHLARLLSEGMTFRSPEGSQLLGIPVAEELDSLEINDSDAVYFTMKTQHSLAAMEKLYATAGPGTRVICCQNGVENERLAARFFRHTYGMVVMLPASHINPGEIVHHASAARQGYAGGILDTGCYPHGRDAFIESVAADLRQAGFSCEVDDHVMRWKYAKLLQNLGNSLQAVAGLGQDAREILSLMVHEALECYRVAGIDCATKEEVSGKRSGRLEMEPVDGFERGGGSSWQSIVRGTGSIEAHYLNGEICLLGHTHGIPTPANEIMRRLAMEVAGKGLEPGSITIAQIRQRIEQHINDSSTEKT